MGFDPTQSDDGGLRSALISAINARRGYFPPPPAALPVATQQEQSNGPGGFLGAVGRGLNVLTSGREAANAVGGFFGHPDIGTQVQQQIERIPVVGRPLGFAADVATSPLTLATAGFGGLLGGAVRGATEAAGIGGFGRFAAPLVEPLVEGALPWRVGAAVAGAGAGQTAENVAEGAGLPAPLQLGAGLLAGGLGIATVGNAARAFEQNATRNLGGLLPSEVDTALAGSDPVAKFTALLSQAEPQNEALAAARSAENAARTKAMYEAGFGGPVNPTEARNIVAAGQVGAMPGTLANFDPTKALSPNDIEGIRQRVYDYFNLLGHPYNYRTAIDAFDNLLVDGKLPRPNEVTLLQNALGPQFGGVIDALRGQNDNTLARNAVSLMAVPRALMTIGEFTVSPFKQAILGISTRAWRDSFAPMIKSLNDPEFALAREEAIRANPFVQEAVAHGAQFTNLSTFGHAEEPFAGTQSLNLVNTLLNSVPGVQMSRRGMGTFLNSYREALITNTRTNWQEMGIDATPERLDSLSSLVNLLSGRSNTLAQFTGASGNQRVAALVNGGLFSPQLTMRNFDALNPKTYLNMDPVVRAQAMRTIGASFGLGLTGLAAMAAAGKSGILPISVGTNPLNSNFGKGTIGDTHIDLWGGFQPIARYAAQLLTGKVEGASGTVYDQSQAQTLGNFGRSKLAPVPSFLIDAITGSNSIGQSVDVGAGQGVDKALAERMTPIFAQNLANAVKADGYSGLLKAFPPTVVSTFTSTSQIRAAGAKELYDKAWADLTGQEQAAVNTAFADKLAQQEPPSGIAGFVQNTDAAARQKEQVLGQALRNGQITNSAFTKAMADLQTQRVQQIQGVINYAGSKNNEPTVLDGYYALRDQASPGGVVDYQLLDQLQHDYVAALPKDGQRIIAERTTFAHDPSVQWWTDARKVIADSGYYTQQTDAMAKLAPLLAAVGVSGMTYDQIRAAANGSTDPAQARLYDAVRARIDAVTAQMKLVLRVQNPALDKALGLVYGSMPAALRGR